MLTFNGTFEYIFGTYPVFDPNFLTRIPPIYRSTNLENLFDAVGQTYDQSKNRIVTLHISTVYDVTKFIRHKCVMIRS